ncbi:MAG: YggS family pyridoxal phosphate-dependent enzyme [Chitinophagaceae bacterium]|nr:MAG: YggS family pyridoxal phosphate-dependent enzyme [Chitinophagaceae bacterium]
MVYKENFIGIKKQLGTQATLVAVSKFKPAEDIQTLYELGERDFGENFVQELLMKYEALPKDIHWHFIGHLQTNKVKYIAPFVWLIHGVDSERLLNEINKQAAKNDRVIDCLLQVHIAQEESKFGFSADELKTLLSKLETNKTWTNIRIRGLMGMASFTENKEKISDEFKQLKELFDTTKTSGNVATGAFDTLSMGMSSDYEIALLQGSTMVRIGSLLFGSRTANG